MTAALTAVHIIAALLRSYGTTGGLVPVSAGAIHRVEWIQADPQVNPFPKCILREMRAWSCWGLSGEARGVVVLHGSNGIWWSVVTARTSAELRPARWGRLLVLNGPRSELPRRNVTFGYPVVPLKGRLQAIRLDTSRVPGAVGVPVGSHAVWVAGDAVPPRSWVEIATDATAPIYLALDDVAAAPPSLLLHVALGEPRAIEGQVVGGDHLPAGGALVTLFRVIDPPQTANVRTLPRRVLSAEVLADERGRFTLRGLGEAEYEIVAWHARLGRASLAVPDNQSNLTVRLQATGVARGRVVAGGRPVEGVDVISVPDTAAFTAAPDMTDVKGGDGRTGPDGTFMVMLSPRGGGELRIGGGRYPVRRIPLPTVPVAVFDTGNVELGQRIRIAVVLDGVSGCDLRAAGPVGRTGLEVISGLRTSTDAFEVALSEPGFWEFSVTCGGTTRSVSPAVIQIGSSDAGREVRMSVR